MCDREGCATPESRGYGLNSSGDMNAQLLNVNGTEPNRQEHDGTHKSGQGVRNLCTEKG